MLIEHCAAPDHTVTATELAALVGYPDANTINLRYGLLARAIAERLHWPVPEGHQESYAVAWFEQPDADQAHWRWRMHPELVQAVRDLGWAARARRRPAGRPGTA